MDIRPQDLKLPGTEYHTSLGAVRTKPGRGDPTRSLSCSDKMLKWRALGMQVQNLYLGIMMVESQAWECVGVSVGIWWSCTLVWMA